MAAANKLYPLITKEGRLYLNQQLLEADSMYWVEDWLARMELTYQFLLAPPVASTKTLFG